MDPNAIIGAALILSIAHVGVSWLEARDKHRTMAKLLSIHNAIAHNPPGPEPTIPLEHTLSNTD